MYAVTYSPYWALRFIFSLCRCYYLAENSAAQLKRGPIKIRSTDNSVAELQPFHRKGLKGDRILYFFPFSPKSAVIKLVQGIRHAKVCTSDDKIPQKRFLTSKGQIKKDDQSGYADN
jgi:hypothetical protein